MHFKVGDRVQVRDGNKRPWHEGVVKEVVDGRLKVPRDWDDLSESEGFASDTSDSED